MSSGNGRKKVELFDVINASLLFVFFMVILYPLIYVVSASFSNPDSLFTGEMWLLPKGFTMDGYKRILDYTDLWIGYANTIFYTSAGTLLNLAATLPFAYALSRKDLIGRNFFMAVIMVAMYFSGGLIPYYLNLKSFNLLDTRVVMLITGLTEATNIIICRTFFSTNIPQELQDAATIDGCTNLGIFVRIVLPLSKAIIAVMALYFGLSHWNSYFNAMIVLRSRELYPLQLYLREILVQSQVSSELLENMDVDSVQAILEKQKVANLLKYVTIVVSAMPMLIVYPFLQRYFIKGVLIGSIKA